MKRLAFVLSGGGSRGALQVGALQALFEAGYRPDLLVGTSIGAVNAAYLAVHGANLESLPGLISAWDDAVSADLLPPKALWLSLRTILNRPTDLLLDRMRRFYVAHGVDPALKFQDIQGLQLVLVAADLNSGTPVLYGSDPDGSVLEGLLASTALPPWISPLPINGRLLIDGGVVSNLPIEPALTFGATEIIALDLHDSRIAATVPPSLWNNIGKLLITVSRRQSEMELALAAYRKVPVRRVELVGRENIPLWDFSHAAALIERGYELGQQSIEAWRKQQRPFWSRLLGTTA
jgi:NTE family protein